MTHQEVLAMTMKDEKPRFSRVFKSVAELPAEQLSYRPDPKARSGRELLTLLAHETSAIGEILRNGKVNMMKMNGIAETANVNEIEKHFSESMDKCIKLCENINSAEWNSEATMEAGEHPWKAPRGMMAYTFLLDLIHHRGQLSTYIRPMGGKNPSIYGPSADSQA